MSLRIALVRPNERPDRRSPLQEVNVTGLYPPLGIAYLAAVLRQHGYEVEIIEAHAENLSLEAIARRVRESGIDLLGITSTTMNWLRALAIAKTVRQAAPRTRIVVGGPHLSLYPREAVQASEAIDAAVMGEGERPLLALVRQLEELGEFAPTPGVALRGEDGAVSLTPPEPAIADLDSIPHPAVDLLPYRNYRALTIQRPFYTMITSRGCPYRCGFCSQVYVGGKFRQRGAEDVLEEMEHYVRRLGARELVLFDETFSIGEERAITICEGILQRGFRFRWNIRARADTITRPLVRALKRAGCYGVHIGVESGCQEILDRMVKDLTLEQIEESFHIAREGGLETRGYFMLGYPGESPATIRQTIAFAKRLPLDWASFSITVPHPGTAIYNEARLLGLISGDVWREYTLGKPVPPIPYFTTDAYDIRTLERYRRLAYRQFYLRPSWIGERLLSPRLYASAFDMIATLAYLLTRRKSAQA